MASACAPLRLPARVPLAGAGYHREAIGAVGVGEALIARHDPTCAADINAVAVLAAVSGERVGYLPARSAARLVAKAGAGVCLDGHIEAIEDGRILACFDTLRLERGALPLGSRVRSRSGLDLGILVAFEQGTVEVDDRHGRRRRWPSQLVVLAPA